MSWKFNPPPGWPPQPAGWQPPPGWNPDPSWPPAPAGWQFWVPVDPSGTAPTAPPAPTIHEAPTMPVATTPASPAPADAAESAGATAAPVSPTAPASGAPTDPYNAPVNPYGDAPASSYGGAAPTNHPAAPYGAPHPYPPVGAPPAKSGGGRWWVFGVLAVVVLLVACLAGSGIAMMTNSSDTTATPEPVPTGPVETDPPDDGNHQSNASGLRPGEERTGEGPAIVSLSPAAGSYHTVTVTFSGEGLFAARLVDDDGEYVASIGSGLHEFTTTKLVELGTWGVATAVDISDANGRWTVSLQDLEESPIWPEQTEGTGPTVLRIDPAVAATEPLIVGTHDGDSNFIVWAYSDPDSIDRLLFNEIGEHSGEASTSLASDARVLAIDADGAWSLKEG